MNATINQWRWGHIDQSLFSRTASDVDTWRLPF